MSMRWVRKYIQTARGLEFTHSAKRGQRERDGEGIQALERSCGFEVRYPTDE